MSGQFFPASPPKPHPLGALAPSAFQFEYLRAYNYVFKNPNWVMNIVWWTLCILAAVFVPVLPYLVLLGHFFEIIISLQQTQGRRYPDFDLNRFSEYLGRSIWPFLVGLIFILPMFVLMYVGMFLVFVVAALGAAAGGEEFGPVVAIGLGVMGMLLLFVIMLVVFMLVTPMTLRAGLQQDFAAAFDFGWSLDFIKKTWLEMVLAGLFVQLTGMLLMMIGLLAFCVGAYAANALMVMAQAFMLYQLYELYLSRGGRPIPVKQPPPTMPTRQVVAGPPPGYQPGYQLPGPPPPKY